MKNEKNSNKGFTLIELIIAIAVLAFLMTAVTSFMTSGIVGYKKAKADIKVHTSAQENYDRISDAIMEAKDIYIFGYLKAPDGSIAPDLYCFVRDNVQAGNNPSTGINANVSKAGNALLGTNTTVGALPIKYYSELSSDTDIYIKALVIDTAVPIEDLSKLTVVLGGYKNAFTGETKDVKQETRKVTDEFGNESNENVVDDAGNPVYNIQDTLRQMFVFEDENMYVMNEYGFMTYKNDSYATDYAISPTTAKLKDYLFSSSFDYIEQTEATGDKKYTKAIAHVDAANEAMELNLYYSDKKMTYTTDGMIKTRNSYVLKAKK